MKRCPQCLFIYPDADARCDFDNTPLVVVDDAELEAATGQPATKAKQKRAPKKPASKKRQRKATAITVVVGLLLSIAAFLVYYRLTHRTQHTAQLQAIPITTAPPLATPIPSPALPTASPAPTTTPIPTKPTTERIAAAHTSTTAAPISTSGKNPGGKPTILLTSGGKIDADEVWRTRDGVWYRRDGIVTLLKRGRVKAIVQ